MGITGYRGLQEVTGGYKRKRRLQEVAGSYKRLQGNTRDLKG